MKKLMSRLAAIAAVFALALSMATAVFQTSTATAATTIRLAANGAPASIPGLQEWNPATGVFQFRTDTSVLAPAELSELAGVFATNLGTALGTTVAVESGSAAAGDVELSIDPALTELGREGYRITVGSTISIVAASEPGLFYGTQTALQWAGLAGLTHQIPAGSADDVPEFEIRGMGVCACIINISMETLESVIRQMAHYKMNELWLEIKLETETLPESNIWGYYTAEQAAHITEFAKQHHVRIIAEVNSPGHMGPWIRNYPELQLTREDGFKEPTRLDISQDVALTTLQKIYDEYMEAFDTGGYWHMGADEYMLGVPGGVTRFPQLLAAAKEKFGDNATEQDLFIDFINQMNAYVKADGRTLRIWNDGIPVNYNIAKLDTDIIVEHWQYDAGAGMAGRSAQTMLAEGHDMVNANKDLYHARPSGLWRQPSQLWSDNWDPMKFTGEPRVDDTSTPGKVLGGKLTVWPDNGPAMTERTQMAAIQETWKYVSQATWGSPRPVATYGEFQSLGNELGRGPNVDPVNWTAVPAGQYQIAAADRFLTSGSPVTMSGTAQQWTLTPTSDGYYKIAAGDQCLALTPGGSLDLQSPNEFGKRPIVQACSTSNPANNLQKWWVKEVPGGFQLVNAISQMPLVANGTAVAQQDPNKVPATVFQFISTGIVASAEMPVKVTSGNSFQLPVSLRNMTAESAGNVVVTLDAPDGWIVEPGSMIIGTMAAQTTDVAEFTVTAPSGATTAALTVHVTWTDAEGAARELAVPLSTALSCAARPTSPEAVTRVSSEQNSSEEVARAAAAIDGNRNTFWHTQWDPTEVAHPHQIVFDMGGSVDLCAVTLTPRQGTNSGAVNGQIKDYELYVTNDPSVAAQAASTSVPAGWGEPVAAGTLPAGFQDKVVALDAPVSARYILLVSKSEQGGLAFTTLGEFSVDVAADDTVAPVVGQLSPIAGTVGTAISQVTVQAADASVSLDFALTGVPGLVIDPATGVISGAPTQAGTFTGTVTVTDPAGNEAVATFSATVAKAPTTPPTTPPSTPPATPTPDPSPEPAPKFVRTAPYTLPGDHTLGERQWRTTCEPYSQTERCRAEIWASVVKRTGNVYSIERGWAFNNLTYLPFMERERWANNPLGGYGKYRFDGEFVGTDGQKWRTECDSVETGRNGCRSYRMTTVYNATPRASGGYTFGQSNEWVFNNIVLFGNYSR